MKTFVLDIYTPFGHYLSDRVNSLTVSSEDFTLGILPEHSPLISTITISKVIIEKKGVKEIYATSGGVIRVEKTKVVLLLNAIESPDEIDLDRAERAKERAENRLSDAHLEPMSVTRSKLALARAMNRINVKKGIQ